VDDDAETPSDDRKAGMPPGDEQAYLPKDHKPSMQKREAA